MSQLLNASGAAMEPARRGDWIKTYTGRKVWPLDFQPGDFHISDVAHSLSNLCRFNGHTRVFYSVAEHSFHVANEVGRRLSIQEQYARLSRFDRHSIVLQAILHDAAECYIGDLVRPMKRCEEFANFARIEDELLQRLFLDLDLPGELHPLVKQVDTEILKIEGELLMDGVRDWTGLLPPDPGFKPEIRGMSPNGMKQVFMAFYQREWTYRQKAQVVS